MWTSRHPKLFLIALFEYRSAHGIVLAPFLFTLYTSDAQSINNNWKLVKFADDTVLLGVIKNDDDTVCVKYDNSFYKLLWSFF